MPRRRYIVTSEQIAAVADLVQQRQHVGISGSKGPSWRRLTDKERASWRAGVRLYLGATLDLGWRPRRPAETKAQRRRPSSKKRTGPASAPSPSDKHSSRDHSSSSSRA